MKRLVIVGVAVLGTFGAVYACRRAPSAPTAKASEVPSSEVVLGSTEVPANDQVGRHDGGIGDERSKRMGVGANGDLPGEPASFELLMQSESRDAAWAPDEEARIQQLIRGRIPGGNGIVVCRQTFCKATIQAGEMADAGGETILFKLTAGGGFTGRFIAHTSESGIGTILYITRSTDYSWIKPTSD